MIFSGNDANMGADVGLRAKQKIAHLLPSSATETRNAYRVLRCVMVIVQVNLFYAVTPD